MLVGVGVYVTDVGLLVTVLVGVKVGVIVRVAVGVAVVLHPAHGRLEVGPDAVDEGVVAGPLGKRKIGACIGGALRLNDR